MIRSPALHRSMLAMLVVAISQLALADAPTEPAPDDSSSRTGAADASAQSELDATLIKMLSGATLEGSYTRTSADSDATNLSREKYTLGEVKKLNKNLWLFPTRIQYGDKDATLPITVPIEWAGDTPVVVVDNLPLPGFGTVSARVMFFADHYAGYWKHGDSDGHLFGTIRREGAVAEQGDSAAK